VLLFCVTRAKPPFFLSDLDDALSVTDLGDGKYKIGVHIADVSYFVRDDTDLDREALARATSVYLVQTVIPMLPRLVCHGMTNAKHWFAYLLFLPFQNTVRESVFA
jgi:hypothetical protein